MASRTSPSKTWHRRATSLQEIPVHEFAYYVALVTWISLMIFNSSFFARYLVHGIFAGTRAICLMLLVVSELSNPIRPNRSYAGILIALVFAFAVKTSAETVLYDAIMIIYCTREKDFRKVAQICLVLTSLLVVFIVLSSLTGVILNYTGWSGGRIRSYLGFRYALFPAQYVYLITCLCIYLLGDRYRVTHAIPLLIANYIVYVATVSRLSYYMAVALIIAGLIVASYDRKRLKQGLVLSKRTSATIMVLIGLSFFLCAVASVALTKAYDSSASWVVNLDSVQLLGGRLRLGHNALQSYRITPFGRELHFSGAALRPDGTGSSAADYSTIDCLYVRALVCYGFVFTGLYLVLMTVVTLQAYREGNVYLVLILVALAVRGTIDNLSLYIQYDTFLLLIGSLMNSSYTLEQEIHGKDTLRLEEASPYGKAIRVP